MKRRDSFENGLVAGAAVAAAVTSPKSAHGASAKPVKERMYVRTQLFGNTDKELRFLQRCGVYHKCGHFSFIPGKGWDVDEINRIIDQNAKYRIKLDMTTLPISRLENIRYGKGPERDREIDIACDMIRMAARAGLDSLRYNAGVGAGVFRTKAEPGRGGYFHGAFRLDQIPTEDREELTKAGRVTAEMNWERITYLLDRIIPVANEYKVRMGCSQQDPPVPDGSWGVTKVLNDFEGMKRFIEIQRSPYHGWNFCIGSIAEMVENPAAEVFPFIEYFGEKKTIFLVHYRNLIGRRYSFRESLPDEGDIDMYRVLKALKEVGFAYGVDPDHLPSCPGDPESNIQAYAYAFGYINAMIQAINGEE